MRFSRAYNVIISSSRCDASPANCPSASSDRFDPRHPRRSRRNAPLPLCLILIFLASLFFPSFFHSPGSCAVATDEQDFRPQQAKLPVAPAPGATVLFDGGGTNLFLSMDGKKINWPVKEGSLISTANGRRNNHAVSKLHFRDADIHVEFMLPEQGPGNSGVYLHGNYEMQIFNSFGKLPPTMNDMGAVYGFSKPMTNASRKPGEWQVYDIRFRAPRRDSNGAISKQGSITAYLNGAQVQNHATFGEPKSPYHPFRYGTTPYLAKIAERQKKTGVGPVFLQDHDSPVRFRNIWVRPLDNQAFLYEPDKK